MLGYGGLGDTELPAHDGDNLARGVFPVGPSDPRSPTSVFYGRYDDDVVRTDAGWRIRHRRYQHGS